MTFKNRLAVIHQFHQFVNNIIDNPSENIVLQEPKHYNNWFVPENVLQAFKGISALTHPDALNTWLTPYNIQDEINVKTVGIVAAGNIPMVSFHDVLSTYLVGHKVHIKLAKEDTYLMTFVINKLNELANTQTPSIEIVHQLRDIDAIIATGSNNSARYFEHYFAKYPNIIRKSRSSVAILTGKETEKDFLALARDIFDYFGLGCRNVSKLYVPRGYDFIPLFDAIEPFGYVFDHHKYKNNYDYQKSIYLLNQVKHFDNGFLLIKEDLALATPVSVVNYEYYDTIQELSLKLASISEQIQCIVGSENDPISTVNFGFSQLPSPLDYADGVDIIEFLQTIS